MICSCCCPILLVAGGIGGERDVNIIVGVDIGCGCVTFPNAVTDVVSSCCCPYAKLLPKEAIKNEMEATAARFLITSLFINVIRLNCLAFSGIIYVPCGKFA
jgi:hypothetical protein